MENKSTFVQVTKITNRGLALTIKDKEYFAAFRYFPDFLSVPVAHVFDVKYWGKEFLSWEKANIDICIESLNHPERFIIPPRRRKFNPKDTGDAIHALYTISQLYANVEHCECEKCERARRISEHTLNVILGRRQNS